MMKSAARVVLMAIIFFCLFWLIGLAVDGKEVRHSYEECKGNMTLYLLKNIGRPKTRHHKIRKEDKKIETPIDDGICHIICCEAKAAGVSEELMVAMCETESGGNPNVTGYDGDAGLFQIIPRFHRERMNRLGINDIYDPKQNSRVAADILREFYAECDGNIYAMLMFYNEGYRGKRKAEQGIYSDYALTIVERYNELCDS